LDGTGVLPGSAANLLGDIHALLGGLQAGDELGHLLADTLGFQVTGFFGHLLDNGLGAVEALLRAGGGFGASGSAQLNGDLLTIGFGSVLLDLLLLARTFLAGPFGTLGLGAVSLGDILAFLILDGLTFHDVIVDFVLMVTSLALRFVVGLTFLGTGAFEDEGSVAELDGLSIGDLPVLDEAVLDEVLLAFLLLLGLEVGRVGRVATLGVAMVAFDVIVVFGFLDHHDLIDTTFAGGGDLADAESDVGCGGSLARGSWIGIDVSVGMSVVAVIVSVSVIGGSTAIALVERERSEEGLLLAGSQGRSGQQADEKSLHCV